MSKLDWSKANRPAGGYAKSSAGSTRKPLTERRALSKYAEDAIYACCRTISARQPKLSRDEVFAMACQWMVSKLAGQGHHDAAVIVGNIKAKRK